MKITYQKGNYCTVKIRSDKYAIYENGRRLATVACPNPKTAEQSAINIVNRFAGV